MRPVIDLETISSSILRIYIQMTVNEFPALCMVVSEDLPIYECKFRDIFQGSRIRKYTYKAFHVYIFKPNREKTSQESFCVFRNDSIEEFKSILTTKTLENIEECLNENHNLYIETSEILEENPEISPLILDLTLLNTMHILYILMKLSQDFIIQEKKNKYELKPKKYFKNSINIVHENKKAKLSRIFNHKNEPLIELIYGPKFYKSILPLNFSFRLGEIINGTYIIFKIEHNISINHNKTTLYFFKNTPKEMEFKLTEIRQENPRFSYSIFNNSFNYEYQIARKIYINNLIDLHQG